MAVSPRHPMTKPTPSTGVKSDQAPDRSRAIGGILIELGRLTATEVSEIEHFASANGLRFGEAAMQLRLLEKSDVDSALAFQFNYPILARGGEYGVTDDVIAGYEPQSPLLEPLRALRSQLILRWYNVSTRKVLAITSPERGDGR
ncbi:MAG: chain length determinant protein tyrosine kinase EpsG, partial [Pseudomonadota bacterium]|nr:chain length determinant protein tyrosine kinase EpsG [Pseudomonadota bacterium]